MSLRAADAEDTFLYWRWHDAPAEFAAAKIETATLVQLLRRLHNALPILLPDESQDDSIRRALTFGPFTDRQYEARLATDLTKHLLPEDLRAQLLSRSRSGTITIHITPSPRLAQVPWELLFINDRTRILEIATVVYDPPATVVSSARTAEPPESGPLFLIDPQLPSGQTLEADGAAKFRRYLERYRDHMPPLPVSVDHAVGHTMDRVTLGRVLRTQRPSRILYFGHVSSRPDQPGTASLHLSDTAATWGLMEPTGGETPDDPSASRPFSALDLLQGTTDCPTSERWQAFGFPDRRPGADIWPMPPRVGMIACEGGADYRAFETFGLVMAMVAGGAKLVTTTRWTMPTDYAFHWLHPQKTRGASPTSDLARQVDLAHDSAYPIDHLVQWQRGQLDRWRRDGDITCSPLVWASLTNTVVP
ncbi:hypothetical protein A5643_10020 [Mycobacterium sp. 1274756.6]|nr:hypothetical protein A5643_10020 [Mycobacterium sp. 1274756.6]